jgi:hypothetical protein
MQLRLSGLANLFARKTVTGLVNLLTRKHQQLCQLNYIINKNKYSPLKPSTNQINYITALIGLYFIIKRPNNIR